MTWFTRALVLLVVAAAATTVQAGVLERTTIARWTVGAYTDDRTGRFSHCATTVPYRSGISLFFFLTRDYLWSMGLYDPRWRLNRGETFYVTYYIDNEPRRRARGRVVKRSFVRIPLADSSALFERFKRGRRLNVVAARDSYAFKLTDSFRALDATMRCVERRAPAPSATVANPFSSRPPAASSSGELIPRSPGSRPARPPARAGGNLVEAAVIAYVLAKAGIPGLRMLPRARVPRELRRFDAVWTADGGLLGTVTIVSPRRATTTIDDVVAAVLALDAKHCRGAFKSGRYPTKGASGTGRLMTVCDGAPYPEMQYTVTRRPYGRGFYVLGVTGRDLEPGVVLDAGNKIHGAAQGKVARR